MGTTSPLAAVATSLLPHVKDPQLAEWLLRQVDQLDAPLDLGAELPASQAKPFLKSKVHHAVSAAKACTSLDMLELFSKDARVSVKRTVASAPTLHDETVERLLAFALKNRDVEVLGPLLDKIPLSWFERQLADGVGGEDAAAPAAADLRSFKLDLDDLMSLMSMADHHQVAGLFDRVIASGDWALFQFLSCAKLSTGSYRTAWLRRMAAERLGSTDRGHGGLDVSDPAAPVTVTHGSLPLESLLSSFRFWDAGRARWALQLCDRVRLSEPVGFVLESHGSIMFRATSVSRTRPVSVDDDAAELLMGLAQSPEVDRSSRGSDRIGLLRSQAATHVASDARQAARHFDALVASGDPSVLLTLLWTLADRRQLTVGRQQKLCGPLAEQSLVTTSLGLPGRFGDGLDDEQQLTLLRSGSLALTLEWLCGLRFSPVTADSLARLAADPQAAFEPPPLMLRSQLAGTPIWELAQMLPTPNGARQDRSFVAVEWLLAAAELLGGAGELYVSSRVDRELSTLRQVLSDGILIRVVDACGADGVRAALRHPGWLHARVVKLVGHDPQVWEGLLKLISTWEQSLTELISTAALLAGVDITDALRVEEPDDASDMGSGSGGGMLQLQLL